MPNKLTEFTYPTDIRSNSKYKFRTFVLKIKKSDWEENIDAAYTNALKLAERAFDPLGVPSSTTKEMTKNKKSNSRVNRGSLVNTIVLPLPNSFSDSQSHGWSEEVGIFGVIGAAAMNTSVGSVAQKIAGKKVGGAVNSILGAAGSVSIDKSIGQAASSAGFRKPLIDPGYFQNYTGSTPRSFTAVWDLVPNSAEEANEIMGIIMKLKQYSSPQSILKGTSLLAPHFFDITISNPFMTAMINLDRVVISNIDVDYSVDGTMQQTFDGVPKYMKLTLQFKELDMSIEQDYSTAPKKGGQ